MPPLYAASVPVFDRYLGQADGLVRRVRNTPKLLEARLQPDMFSAAEQFATAAGFALPPPASRSRYDVGLARARSSAG